MRSTGCIFNCVRSGSLDWRIPRVARNHDSRSGLRFAQPRDLLLPAGHSMRHCKDTTHFGLALGDRKRLRGLPRRGEAVHDQ